MMITGLFHVALRTEHLTRTIRFFEQVMGMHEVPRPPNIKFPGAWLALPDKSIEPIIHLYAGVAAVGPGETLPKDNIQGVVDHLSLTAKGYHDIVAKLNQFGLSWRAQNTNPENLQLFFNDPNGLKIELSFVPTAEGGLPSVADAHKYRANERFFVAEQYRQFD
jgi:catechol 2,3-dioxygenase-like lactoylglutathione lyase family enzyme